MAALDDAAPNLAHQDGRRLDRFLVFRRGSSRAGLDRPSLDLPGTEPTAADPVPSPPLRAEPPGPEARVLFLSGPELDGDIRVSIGSNGPRILRYRQTG